MSSAGQFWLENVKKKKEKNTSIARLQYYLSPLLKFSIFQKLDIFFFLLRKNLFECF